jgi:transcriptional regulator of acetoin/glycerol metabolism
MDLLDTSQMFSNPVNDAGIMSAWERFLSGGGTPSDSLRYLIDVSWQRCVRAQVDPRRGEAPPPLSDDTLRSLREAYGELLTSSAPVMAHARNFLAETGTVMALTDPSGMILSLEGDPATIAAAESIHLLAGANWNEVICGTNAIGTALEIGQPVQIHSAEHFCVGIKRWTCSATVIRHPHDREILGVIDVSGLSESYSRHSLALVVTTASRIENRLATREMERRYRLLECCLKQLSGDPSDGVVVFDHRGYPAKGNDKAEVALTAQGSGFSLSSPRRISALAVSTADAPGAIGRDLPAWIRSEWLEPVIDNGERIGTVLTIPLPRRCGVGPGAANRANAQATTEAETSFAGLIGSDPSLLESAHKARQLAKSNVPVLLLGETGAGKELFAQGIHQSSRAKDGPFVALNCGGLSRELLASELFGYSDGAFTGARRGGVIGKIEAANGGTLFLDEIGEMPLDLQPHFLRVLEQGEIYRLGENSPRKTGFRLVAATHRDLRGDVAAGRFRMDLFYRVAVTSVRVPPLRDRKGDIRILAEHFMKRFASEHSLGAVYLEEAVVACLEAYAWPGNVRELRNVIESILLMSHGECLGVDTLPAEIQRRASGGCGQPAEEVTQPQRTTLEASEEQLIRQAIGAAHGNLALAARSLGIAKSTLYLKVKKYVMDRTLLDSRAQRS